MERIKVSVDVDFYLGLTSCQNPTVEYITIERLEKDIKLLAEKEEKNNIYFVGRLANYKYFNMDQAIDNALQFFNNNIKVKYSTNK